MCAAAPVGAGASHRSGSGGGTWVVPFERLAVQSAPRRRRPNAWAVQGRRHREVALLLDCAGGHRRDKRAIKLARFTGSRAVRRGRFPGRRVRSERLLRTCRWALSPALPDCRGWPGPRRKARPVRGPIPTGRIIVTIRSSRSPDRHLWFSSPASNFLKSSRSRIGSREASVFMWEAFLQPDLTAWCRSSIAASAYSCFLSASLPLATA